MHVVDGRIHYTPSELASYGACAYDGLRRIDRARGLIEQPAPSASDPLRDRLGELGRDLQADVLEFYRERYGQGLRSLPSASDFPTIAAGARALRAELTDRTDAVHNVPVAAGRIYGTADLLVRYGDRWQLVKVKLAHRVKSPTRIQIGAFAQALIALGVPLEIDALVHLGNGTTDAVPLVEVLEESTTLRHEFEAELDARAGRGPVQWDEPGLRICGWCDSCREAAHLARDVRTVAGLKMEDRAPLVAAGITTIDELASGEGPVEGLDDLRLADFRAQARLQVIALPPGAERDPSLAGPVAFELRDRTPIDQLPAPSPGDLFFDFESDPMWRSPVDPHSDGLEYLFGMWVPARVGREYVAFWAHDRAQERHALEQFLTYVDDAIARDEDLHIYHYSAYEPNVLLKAARRHEVGVDQVTRLIDGGYFVDLLPVVRGAIRTSQDGFGLKKIEPLYMGEQLRDGSVVDAAASVVGYQQYTALRDTGRLDEALSMLEDIADYNRYDCLSTYRLRNWLLSLVG